MSEKKGNKFIKGAAILGVAGVLIKVLGAVLRIPLTNKLGDGMAYYGVAYTIYSVFLVLSTAGIPVAISRMVSERIAVGEYRGAHKVFKVALRLMFTIGLISSLVCYFGADYIAAMLKVPESALSLKAIAPAVFLVPLFSAFRGYFQGRQNMNPTAISEIMEQVVRVVVGLTLAWTLFSKGLDVAAAGATFGASAGAIAGLGIIFMIYMLNRRIIHNKMELHSQDEEGTVDLLKKIAVIAIPIIIGAEIMPIMTTIDTAIIMNRLTATGWTNAEATNLYSQYSAYCNSLIAFPQIFTQAVAVSLVPLIAAAHRLGDRKKVQDNIKLGMRMTMIMGIPCSVGIFILAKPILVLLYPYQKASAIAATATLMVMAVGVVFLAIAQTTTGILQSIGKQNLPVRNLAIGALVKIGVTYVLVGWQFVNVRGAAVGTIVAYIITLVLNQKAVRQYTGVRYDIGVTFLKPALASAGMAAVVFAIYKLSNGIFGNSIATLLSIAVGALVYMILIFTFKAITLEEVKTMPGGNKLAKIIGRFVRS